MIFKLAGEIRVKGEWELEDERVFLGAGEAQLDLSRARIGARYPRLTVFCGMGEVCIKLLPDVPVLVNGMTALGEREVLGRHDEGLLVGSTVQDMADTPLDDPSVLTVTAICLMGEVEIERLRYAPRPDSMT